MCNLTSGPFIHRPFKSSHYLLPKRPPLRLSAKPPQSQKIPRDSLLKKPELLPRLQSGLHGSAKAPSFTMHVKGSLTVSLSCTEARGMCALGMASLEGLPWPRTL